MAKDFFKEVFIKFLSISKILKIVLNSIYTDFNKFDQIKQPTYIFWGNTDEIFSSKMGEVMNKAIGKSKLKFVEGNHDWPLLMPQKFFDLICKIV